MPPSPTDFPRRILVAVCGLSPQILTETLYALAITAKPAFIPTEIHLLTTREGAHRARLMLLHSETGKFHQLRHDYGLPEIAFSDNHIHVIPNRNGAALDDIRTPDENEAMADAITAAIRNYTLDEQTALHVSMAGGRKTMGYYAGYALSLFGRQQDRLSHVLVTPDYESNPKFFYPTPYSQIIYTREQRPLDTHEAEVILAEIPFIRLRDEIPGRLLKGQAGFSETIALTRQINQEPRLVLNSKNQTITANDIPVKLPAIQLAFYLWAVTHSVLDEKPLPKPGKDTYNREYSTEFLRYYQTLVGEVRDLDKTDKALQKGMDNAFFEEKISRINKALEKELGQRLAQHFKINNRGRRGQSDYVVELNPDQIQII